jgi:CRP/FNR family transcriptional regulator, cyclic AMP receptor protein
MILPGSRRFPVNILRRFGGPLAMSKQSEFDVILGLNSLFADLGNEAVNRIAAMCHTQHLAPREVLFQKGDLGDALYRIRRGQIRIETGTFAAS